MAATFVARVMGDNFQHSADQELNLSAIVSNEVGVATGVATRGVWLQGQQRGGCGHRDSLIVSALCKPDHVDGHIYS